MLLPPSPNSSSSSDVSDEDKLELTDGVKAFMEQRLSLLRDNFVRKNGVGPKLPSISGRLKRDVGKLKRFIDMPLDVFLEIASSIEPLDLIYLSRVNKEFRATFMSRSARFVWTRVLERVSGLPGCPPDMTEPQYASLIFEQQCTACNSVRASKVYFTLRVRFCSACSSGNLRRGRNILPYPAWPFEESIYRLLPSDSTSPYNDNDQWGVYLVSEVNLVVEECIALKDDIPALQKYMSDREVMTTAIMRHGATVQYWYNKRKRDAAKRKDELIIQRRNDIYEKLEELGCDPQYYPRSKYTDHSVRSSMYVSMIVDEDKQMWLNLVEQPKEPTDRSWKILRPKLEELYEKVKQRKLDVEAR